MLINISGLAIGIASFILIMIYVMDEGRVVQQGSHEALMQEPGLYHSLFSEQTLLAEIEG